MLPARARPGIFLGYSEFNGTWLIGYWKPDARTSSGVKFGVYEHWKCRFDQAIVIANVEDLKKVDTTLRIRFPLYTSLRDSIVSEAPMDLLPATGTGQVDSGSTYPTESESSDDVKSRLVRSRKTT